MTCKKITQGILKLCPRVKLLLCPLESCFPHARQSLRGCPSCSAIPAGGPQARRLLGLFPSSSAIPAGGPQARQSLRAYRSFGYCFKIFWTHRLLSSKFSTRTKRVPAGRADTSNTASEP